MVPKPLKDGPWAPFGPRLRRDQADEARSWHARCFSVWSTRCPACAGQRLATLLAGKNAAERTLILVEATFAPAIFAHDGKSAREGGKSRNERMEGSLENFGIIIR